MTDKVFKVIDAINRSGIDNGNWGVKDGCEDTKAEFGTAKVHRLEGKWLYAYTDNEGYNEIAGWSPSAVPDFVSTLEYGFSKESRICFYKLEETAKIG